MSAKQVKCSATLLWKPAESIFTNYHIHLRHNQANMATSDISFEEFLHLGASTPDLTLSIHGSWDLKISIWFGNKSFPNLTVTLKRDMFDVELE